MAAGQHDVVTAVGGIADGEGTAADRQRGTLRQPANVPVIGDVLLRIVKVSRQTE